MNEKTNEGGQLIRREFLASAGSGLLLLKPETVFGSQANSALEMGLIGCGLRGVYDAVQFKEYTGAHFVALADAFQDPIDRTRQKLTAPDARQYLGFNAYKELLASHVDAVLIATPPYFHPLHAAAAVDAGKHVFLAKPVAVDVPGTKWIAATGKKAEGKLSFLVDFWSEGDLSFQECAARLKQGDIGKPAVAQAYYHAPRLPVRFQSAKSASEARLRNWVFDKTISGDIIIEQNVHVLADVRWFLGALPLRARGTGGRSVRVDAGDCWDHFVVAYDYPDGVHVDFSSSQFTKGFNDICTRIFGSEGTLEAHHYDYAPISITGDHPWKPDREPDGKGLKSVVANEKKFVDSIRSGQYVNNVDDSVKTNLTALLGRTAAYKGTVVTMDELIRSDEKYELSLPGIG
jgi:predicted dehydrogenase